MNPEEIKKDFSILKNNKISYLDSGATTQKPESVIKAVDEYYKKSNANPHRGSYSLSLEATKLYESAREKVAKFINSKTTEQIIFTKNATESLNLIAYSYGLENIQKDDEIVISIMEHHSNLVPWQMVAKTKHAKLKYIYMNEKFEIDEKEIKEKITNKTKIVAITQVSNVLGTINDVKKITKYAHERGAVVIVDASQSIPHMKVDVQNLDADFLVFSGHKMLAPMGIGVIYGKKELLENMTPFLRGGDMIEYVHEQETTFAQIPHKFEAGTQNVGGAVGLSVAIDYLEKIGMNNIQKIERELLSYAKQELRKLDYIEIYCPENEQDHASVISFNVKGIHPHDVATILDSHGVAIRTGHHCAQPLMEYMGVTATCRASFYIYNTKQDVDNLIGALKDVEARFAKFMK